MKAYSSRKKTNNAAESAPAGEQASSSVPNSVYADVLAGRSNSVYADVLAGRSHASSAMMGHRQDLAPSLAAKMSKAFGMDLSNVKLYRSQAMAQTGARGMASGNKIVLSKDIDLNTMAGQAVLGHELSHVYAQSQGIGMGHSGLYENAALEHRADTEGWMAARGQSILGGDTGMETGPGMSGIAGLTPLGAGMSASAGAPMQASWKNKKKRPDTSHADEDYKKDEGVIQDDLEPWEDGESTDWLDVMNEPGFRDENEETYGEWRKKKRKELENLDYTKEQKLGLLNTSSYMGKTEITNKRSDERWKAHPNLSNKGNLGGANLNRVLRELDELPGYTEERGRKIEEIYSLLENKTKKNQLLARKKIKEIYFEELKRKEKKYGRLMSQMNFTDLLNNSGKEFQMDMCYGQQMSDCNLIKPGVEPKYVSPEDADEKTDPVSAHISLDNEEDEKRYQELDRYFGKSREMYFMYSQPMEQEDIEQEYKNNFVQFNNLQHLIHEGPSFNEAQQASYDRDLANRKKKK